jgi:hypothetical protein
VQLSRPKYGLFNIKCDQCRDENYRMGDGRFLIHPYFRFNHNGALPGNERRVLMIDSYCDDCVKLNTQITDQIMKYGAHKNGNGTGRYQPYSKK